MFLRNIVTQLNEEQKPNKLQNLKRNLEIQNFNIVYEKEETLQDFLQIFQANTLVKQNFNNNNVVVDRNSNNNSAAKEDLDNLLIGILSALVLEKKYEKFSDLKIFNLMSILSTKIKMCSNKDYLQKSLSLGIIYLYLIKKIYPNLLDFNPTHKKIKQRCEDDAKNFVKLLENSFNYIQEQYYSQQGIFQQEMGTFLGEYLGLLVKVVQKTPNVFKTQRLILDQLLREKVVLDAEGVFSDWEDNQIAENGIFLLSLLPNCVLKQIDYQDNIKTALGTYFNLYTQLNQVISFSNSNKQNNENDQQEFQSNNNQQQSNFNALGAQEDEEDVNNIEDKVRKLFSNILQNNNKFNNNISLVYYAKRLLKNITQTIQNILQNIKPDQGIELEIKNYLKIIEQVVVNDHEFLDSVQSRGQKVQKQILQASIEKNTTLTLEEYQTFSIYNKQQALQIMEKIADILGSALTLHIDYVYNTLYFICQNYLQDYPVLQLNLNQTIRKLLGVLRLQMSDFCQSYIFTSMHNPLQIVLAILQNVHNLEKSKNETKIKDEMQFTKQRNKKYEKGSLQVLSFSVTQASTEDNGQAQQVAQYVNKLHELNLISEFFESNLMVLRDYLSSCGYAENMIENVARFDAMICKVFLYPSIIVEKFSEKSKRVFFDFLQELVFNNSVKQEENMFMQELNQFLMHYAKSESDQNLVFISQGIQIRLQQLRLSKKISHVDNSLILTSYLDNLQQQIQNENYYYCAVYKEDQEEFEKKQLRKMSQQQQNLKKNSLEIQQQQGDEPQITKKVKLSSDLNNNNNKNEGWEAEQDLQQNNKNQQQQLDEQIEELQEIDIENQDLDLIEDNQNNNNIENDLDEDLDENEEDEDENNNDSDINQHMLQEQQYQMALNNMPKPCFE